MEINIDIAYQNTEKSKELDEKSLTGFVRSEYRRMIGNINRGNAQYVLDSESFGKAIDQVCEYYLSMGYDVLSVTAYKV
jgi:hypothetical protein